jgi:hypothetical protein
MLLIHIYSHIEMALFDDPAIIDKVKEVTGESQVYWIGFALGNKQLFLYLANAPKNCANIKAMWAMAPQCYLYNTRSPIARALSIASKPAGVYKFIMKNKLRNILKCIFYTKLAIKLLGSEEFGGKNVLMDTAKNLVCTSAGSCPICDNIMMAFGGFNKKQSDKVRLSMFFYTG